MSEAGFLAETGSKAITVKSIGDVITEKGGYTSGFDYMRIILALGVIFLHSFGVTGTPRPFPAIFTVAIYFLLPMFFALSGFLVTASLLRVNSIVPFFTLRGLRLGPALLVEVLVSALILGPLLTTVSWNSYFSSSEFRAYFLNIVGWPHYSLPGLFKDGPSTQVNGSLWTVPYEAECYIALGLAFLLGFVRHRVRLLIAVAGATVVLQVVLFCGRDLLDPTGLPRVTFTGRQLVLCFLVSVLMYLYRDRIPHSRVLFAGSAVISLLTITHHDLVYVAIPFLCYMTVFLGLRTPRKLPLIFTGDYSYGIYLYGAPTQQAVRTVFGTTSPYANFLVALPLLFALAAFSWHAIEKRFLALRRLLIPARKRSARHPPSGEMISPEKTITAVAES